MIHFVVSSTVVLIIGPPFIIILYQFLHSKNKGNLDNLRGQRGGRRRQWENVVSARTPLSSLPRNHICTIWREHRTPEPPQPNALMMQKPSRRGYTAPQGRVVRNCWKPICPIFNIVRFPFSSYPGRVILIWWFFELCDTKVPGFVWFSGGACSDYIPGWIYVYGGGPLCWVIGWIDCGSGLLIISLLLIISGLLIISWHVGGLYHSTRYHLVLLWLLFS